jgi:hypothetical protein
LLVLYIGDRFSGPPPDVQSLITAAIIFTPLFLVWPWWFDRHRIPIEAKREEILAADPTGTV